MQATETQNNNRLSPLRAPLNHDIPSIDHDDRDNEAVHRSPDVHTSLLRKLSLVEFEEKISKYEFRRRLWFKAIISLTCITSVVSVCLNTPATFKQHPHLLKITLGIDIIVAIILTAEIVIKSLAKGFIQGERSYLRSRGRVFELSMVFFIYLSIIFQIFEAAKVINPYRDTTLYPYISGLRSPRPLLLFRVGKNLLHLSIPRNVSRKPLRQIRNVLIFTMYFMTLASVIGVQIFGPLAGYCVKKTADAKKLKYNDLMIPATRCPIKNISSYGYKCPREFVCKELKLSGFQQMTTYFEQAASGLLTVYEAQSQEGWSSVMYAAMDSNHFFVAVVYFIFLIFFIAWLAKNIFIAIVTEVFADLRSQVQSLYSSQNKKLALESTKILKKSETGMKLIEDKELMNAGRFRIILGRVVKSFVFKIFFLLCIIVDAFLQAYFSGQKRINSQIAYTVLFDFEVLLKVICYGPTAYIASIPNRFECFLAIGSSAFLLPLNLKMEEYAFFQVMRPFRLILAWPSLESFLKRILGSGKKLGSLLLFTLIFLVISAGVSLQLFCNIGLTAGSNQSDGLFHTFPEATQSMFQVLMQEAWNDVMGKMLISGGLNMSILVFPYFILFHVLAAVILISVFVALILDNLELDEELKLIKQKQLSEDADINYKVPSRLRFFKNFKAHPKIVKVQNIGCNVPKVRETFMSNYITNLDDTDCQSSQIDDQLESSTISPQNDVGLKLISVTNQTTHGGNMALRKQSSVTALIRDSHERKFLFNREPATHAILGNRGTSVRRRLPRQVTEAGAIEHQGPPRYNGGNMERQGKQFNAKLEEKGIDVNNVRQRLQEAQRKKETQVQDMRENYPYFDKALFFLPYDSKFRCFLRKIVHARYEAFSDSNERQRFFSAFSVNRFKMYLGSQAYLDWLMILLTHISCWVMMLETPKQRTFQWPLTNYVETIFVVTTTIEIGMKIMADGLFLTPTALVQDFGGVLHVFIYIVSLVYVIWRPNVIRPGSSAQVLLILRALRPLRIITLAPPLRKVVKILVRGYKDILKVGILQALLMFVFANYGVQMFTGALGQCTNPLLTKENCHGICSVAIANPKKLNNLQGNVTNIAVPCVWRNPRNFNFDSLPNAFLALFEVLSLEGWTEVRDILSTKIGWFASVYLHLYVCIACLIGLTLFIGVVVSNFNENKGTALLTVDQRRWVDLKKRLKLSQPIHIPPRPEDDESRGRMYDFLQTKLYRWTYIGLIILNGSTLLYAEWYPASLDTFKSGDRDLHLSFTIIAVIFCYFYVIDFILKIKAYRFSGFWLSWRNRFDLILTVAGVVWSLPQIISYKFIPIQAVTLRIGVAIIICRLFTLAGKLNSLRMLMLTVGMSLFKSFFTISVLVVLMMCYALIGVILFGSVKNGLALNRHANFRNSWRAMLLLFRITTGEDWNKLMRDCMISPPQCVISDTDNYWATDCGNTFAAILFFSSYYLLITYIFLNLFIAVVIENFSLFSSTDEDMLMTSSDLKAYQEVWNLFDEDRSGKLTAKKAKLALGMSVFKLGFNLNLDRFLYKRMCVEIDRVSNGKEISFHELLLVLAYNDSRVKLSRNLQLEERLARADQVRAIVEQVAAQTIRTWCVKMWREKVQRKKEVNQRLFAKQSVSSSVSTISIDSDNSEYDDLNMSMTSTGSSLNVPRHIPEKRSLTKTSSYPLERLQKTTQQQKENAETKEEISDKYSAPKDIYEWWLNEVDIDK